MLLTGLATWMPAEARQNAAGDVEAIERLVEFFCSSLIGKDKPICMGLFFSDKREAIGWQIVWADTRLEHIRQTKANAIKVRHVPSSNFISLIDAAVATPEPREETCSNVKVETDG